VLIRVLAALGVGAWCIFILFLSVVFVIDRGLADVGIVWAAVLGIGVAAPVLLLRQVNRAITAHEEFRRYAPDAREKEKELLGALEDRRELTPATAAMRTSLTVDEASEMLEELARKGHLQSQMEDGVIAYALGERDGQGSPGNGPSEKGSHADRAPHPLEDPLSERELEVLALLASGRTNSEVARDLFVSVGTVKSHTGNIYRKLGAKNRMQALARARELKLLP
jgi:DNA-binding CsgD family transcriptional regulator